MRDGKVCKGKHGYVKNQITGMLMQEPTDVFYRNNLSPTEFVQHKGKKALLPAMQKLNEEAAKLCKVVRGLELSTLVYLPAPSHFLQTNCATAPFSRHLPRRLT
ncbi:uncharacterized protein LOC144555257 [Carex rostrata]